MSVQTEIDRIITAVGAAYDAVEEKGGTLPASETVANLAEAINSIPKETHQAVEQATPSLSLNAATGVVTAEATQAAGLVAAGTKKATMQLATQAAKTVTPSAAQQTAVASGKYTTGNVVVAAVPTEAKTVELSMPSGNQTVSPSSGKFLSAVTVKKPATMLPENIKKGVTIGGVVGTLESGGGGSTSETWVLNDELIETPTFIGAVKFTSSGTEFFGIYSSGGYIAYWNDVNGEEMTPVTKEAATPEENAWLSPQYRKLVFDEAPTGELLQWLQFMGVKQPANLAVQPSKDVTITSNGTTEVTPDAPYDVMEKANVTVNVPTGGGGNIDALIDRTIQEITSNASKVGGSVFKDCFSLTTVNLPKATSIGSQAFFNCSSLTALVLSNTEEVCTLGSNALLGSLIASKTGHIYVPDALVSSYKTATNWKAYASQIKPLSEYSA